MVTRQKLPGGRIEPEEVLDVNEAFQRQVAQYQFNHRCCECIHYNVPEDLCSMRFPRAYDPDAVIRCRNEEGALLFCKYFELN